MRKDNPPLQEHLGQIAQTELVADPPQDHEADDIARVLQAVEASAGALVKLSPTSTTAKAAVSQLRALRPFHRLRCSTMPTFHLPPPLAGGGLRFLIVYAKLGRELPDPSLRAIPGMIVLRPADANEVVEAWKVIMQLRHRPAALVLTRQAVPTLDRTKYAPAAGVERGAYVLADAQDGKPDVLLLATGSEVALCVDAFEQLQAESIKARVVSMPCWELFDQQSQEYKGSVIPAGVTARVCVEQASTLGWERFAGQSGEIIGMKTFGASAPLQAVQKKFGFLPDRIIAAAKEQIAKTKSSV